MSLDHRRNQINFTDPVMPGFLDETALEGLTLDASRLDIMVTRHGLDVTVNVLSRTGSAKAVLSK